MPGLVVALTLGLWLQQPGPEPPRIAESVTVTAAPALELGRAEPLAQRYDGELVRSLTSVAASDPLRAVQALPGVAANDDFNASFASRGSGFAAAGLYIDGVRLEAPFHSIRDINDGYTLTILNADVIESVALMPGTAPAAYGDRVGATLAVRTRPGRSDGLHARATAGAAGVYATVEGPLGGRASWLASARKSFFGYVIERVEDDPQLALGWRDLTTRVTLRPGTGHALSLVGLFGRSEYTNTEPSPGPHELASAGAGTDLLLVSYRRELGPTLDVRAFLLRQTGLNRDADGFVRFSSTAFQGGLQAMACWARARHRLEAGLEARSVGEDVLSRRFETPPGAARTLEDYDVRGLLLGAWLQDSWKLAARASLTLGARVDHLDTTGETQLLPRAALELGLSSRTRVVAAWGAYSQFPRFAQLFGEHGNPELEAERSRQAELALEQALPAGLRLRAAAYAQQESDLVFNRALEYRLVAGRVVRPDPLARLENSLAGPSRGLELALARPAGRVTGWVAFAWAHARRSDGQGGDFDADFHQRHTFTAFARADVGWGALVSSGLRYGSGFPFPGFLSETPAGVFVAAERNRFGPPPFARLDLRAEKRFRLGRARLGVFVEVANLLDRENVRYNEITSVSTATGRARLDRDTLMPRVPFFGVSLEL
jgi:hypothetical protein